VLGLLAIAGGIGASIYNRNLLGKQFSDFRRADFPKLKEGERPNFSSRNRLQRVFRFARFGFFSGLPIFLIIDGGLLLIGGVVLLIIAKNKAKAGTVVNTPAKTPKKPTAQKATKKTVKKEE